MANRIKGITVEIGGDTTKLQTALKGVNSEIKNTQSQLKDVEKLLKLDPGNTELLSQKHKLLGQAVSETKEKLETLKAAAEQANTALANGDISQKQYDALQREIIETENELRRLVDAANQSATAVQKIAATGEKLQTLGDNISSAGTKLLPVTAGVTAVGAAAVKTAADFDSAMSQVAAVSGATGSDLEALRDKAREMGSKTKFSASEAAEAIGLMANAGIKSSQAGTSLRTIMNNLTGEVKLSGAAFGEVTIATTNADGSMRGLSEILADCRSAFGQMTESEKANAAETLVGKNAMSGFLALMNAAPADIDKLSGAIANCDGKSAEMAATMQDNLAGQLTILKSQLEELAISFGEMLMPVIRSVVSAIQSFVDWLNGMDEGTRKVVIGVGLFAAALGPVLIVVGKVISAVGTIMTIVPKVAGVINTVKGAFAALNATMLANPIVLIIAAIAALVAAFIYLWNTNEDFRQFWIDLWENIKEVAVAVWNAIKEFFAAAWEAISSTAQTVWNGIKDFFSGLWEGIKSIFSAVVEAIKTVITTYFNIYKTIITTVLNAIKTVISTVWNAIKTVVTTVVTAIRTFLTTAWNAIKTVITTVLNAIKTVITTVWNGIKTAVTTVVNGIKTTISTVWNGIKSTVTSVVNGIKSTVTTVFTNIWNGIKNTMGKIVSSIKEGFNNAVSFITSLPSKALQWGKDIIMGIVNGIKGCISAVGDAVKSVADKIKSFLHFSVPDEGPLTDYESWMPDFMKGLAKGIEGSKSMVARAMDGVASDMVLSPNVNATACGEGAAPAQSDSPSGITAAIREAFSELGGQNGDIVIPVYLGGTMLDEVIVSAQQRANLRSGGR